MLDLYYLGGAMLFFALMLVYVVACERLGGASTTAASDTSS